MLVVMEMATGKIIEDEFGSFEDEVLNAEWQPPLPALQLALHGTRAESRSASGFDADACLNTIYSSQE